MIRERLFVRRIPASASVDLIITSCWRSEPDLDDQPGQVGKVLGDKWKALSTKDRKPYEDKAKQDKERYETEKAAYQNVCPPSAHTIEPN